MPQVLLYVCLRDLCIDVWVGVWLSILPSLYQSIDQMLEKRPEVHNGVDHSGAAGVVVYITPAYIIAANVGNVRCVLSRLSVTTRGGWHGVACGGVDTL